MLSIPLNKKTTRLSDYPTMYGLTLAESNFSLFLTRWQNRTCLKKYYNQLIIRCHFVLTGATFFLMYVNSPDAKGCIN